MQLQLSLVALFLIATMVMVAPVDCACRVDLHRGEAFHPVFAHQHPDAPAEADDLTVAASGGPEFHGAHATASGSPVLAGVALPRVGPLDPPRLLVGQLARADDLALAPLFKTPLDPPPRTA